MSEACSLCGNPEVFGVIVRADKGTETAICERCSAEAWWELRTLVHPGLDEYVLELVKRGGMASSANVRKARR